MIKKLPVANISLRFIRVWSRNLTVYKKIWLVNFLVPLFEPLLYLAAFGVGLSTFIEKVPYHGKDLPYLDFIAPALIAITIMYNAFFENTYASFVRMYYQKTFDAIMATPLSLEDVITGEIVWGATKALIATVIMLAVISLFGLVSYPEGLLILPLAFLGGLFFGTVGMSFTGVIPSVDMFNLPIFLFITPMFLFSGTFFPVSGLPQWAQTLSTVFPLTHLVDLSRALCQGNLQPGLLWSVLYLMLSTAVCFPLALILMRRRLIQ
ncbi:MAG: ABC transporter permease [Desulfobacteraceae bacterium]|nr:ABC transporter permease [Desulfobacteraceae bacterium]